MDSSTTRGSPTAQIENSPTFQTENFCVKVNWTEDDYKIEFEHKHNQKASIHALELASSITDILKRTITKSPVGTKIADATTIGTTATAYTSPVYNTLVNVGSGAESACDSRIIAENQKLNAEVLLLRQRNQELERNGVLWQKDNKSLKLLIEDLEKARQTHERKLAQLSELSEQAFQANRDLIEGFRAATHAKAERLATQYYKADADYPKVINRTPKYTPPPVASSTQEIRGTLVLPTSDREPQVFVENPMLKQIDFFSLEDILSKESEISVSTETTLGDYSEENDDALAKITHSLAGTVFDDNETYRDDLSTRKFELPKVAPPTILKVGLNAEIARAGGVCETGISNGSPIYRHHRTRDLPRKIVSYAEHEDTLYADDDLPGHTSKVLDVRYNPSANTGSELKGVIINNLPLSISYEKLLAKVRGGTIVSAILCDTRTIAGCGHRMSALIVFMKSESAKLYVEFARKHGIYFDSERATATLINTPTYPLSVQAKNRIECNHHTRYFMIREDGSNLDLVRITRIINFEVSEYRKEAMIKAWKDEDGNVRVLFASISAASNAHWRLTKRLFYDPARVEFQDDPCGGPLTELLLHHKIVDSTELKLNYGDEDFEDKKCMDVGPAIPEHSKIINNDEIDLEDGEDEKSDVGNMPSGTAINQETLNIQEMIQETPLKNLSTVVERMAETTVVEEARLPQGGDSKQSFGRTNPDTIACPAPTSPEKVSQPQTYSANEASIIAQDIVIEEPVAGGTIEVDVGKITPTTPEPSRSLSKEISSVMTGIKATPVFDAAEKQDTKSTPSPQTTTSPSEQSSPIHAESPQTPNSDIAVVEEIETKTVPSSIKVASRKFEVGGTDIDPQRLAGYALQKVLAAKPRGGLCSSNWAGPNTKPAAPIIIKAPNAIPLVRDAEKTAYELLFGKGSYEKDINSVPKPVLPMKKSISPAVVEPISTIISQPVSVPAEPTPAAAKSPSVSPPAASQAPLNAPKGPRASLSNSRSPTTTTKPADPPKAVKPACLPAIKSPLSPLPPPPPKNTPHKPKSRYENLRPDKSQPRATLRSFYSDVDSMTAAKGR